MRPSSWSEYSMMVRAITGLDHFEIWERYPYALGKQDCALWWNSKRHQTLIPTASPTSGAHKIL
jgi:hypothetical protein